jgi:hypothetical protein
MEPLSIAKKLVLALTLTAIAVSFVGCGRGEEVATQDRPSKGPPASVSEKTDEGPVDDRDAVETGVESLPPPEELEMEPAADVKSASEPEPEATSEPTEEDASQAGAADDAAESEPDFGTPLVDDPEDLVRLHPKYPTWVDEKRKSVVLVGTVCQRRVPLELFACLKGSKEHESVLVVDTEAYLVHAGLVAAGADPGGPVQFYPEYIPARGPEVEVTVVWKDPDGDVKRARAQEWIRDVETGKSMEHPWVFAGSFFTEDEQTGERYYHGDTEGDLICVANFPSAVLDLPIQSSDSNTSLLFEGFAERIPPIGTPVTLVLTPKVAPNGGPSEDSSEAVDAPPESPPDSADQGEEPEAP